MNFDYSAPAELYLGRDTATAEALGPKTFAHAAAAISFALEEAAPVMLRGARLETSSGTYSARDMQRLHVAPEFPLARKADRARQFA